MRKLGIRLKRFPETAIAHPAFKAVEVFDVESGETVGGFSCVAIKYSHDGAITAEGMFYPAVIDTIETK